MTESRHTIESVHALDKSGSLMKIKHFETRIRGVIPDQADIEVCRCSELIEMVQNEPKAAKYVLHYHSGRHSSKVSYTRKEILKLADKVVSDG